MKVGAPICRSPYQWLTNQLAFWQSEVQKYATTEEVNQIGNRLVVHRFKKISADAVTAQKYRYSLDNYLDVAKALSLNNSGITPRTFALTTGLTEAMFTYADATGNLESLKMQEAQAAYNGTLGSTPAPSVSASPTPETDADIGGGGE